MTTNVKNNKIDKIIEIKPKDKGTAYSQLCELADRLAQIFYGKNFSDCVGKAQQCHTKKYKGTRFVLHYPDLRNLEYPKDMYNTKDNKKFRKKYDVPAYKFKKTSGYVSSIIKHVRSYNVDIVVKYYDCGV